MKPGDKVEVEIDKVGILENSIGEELALRSRCFSLGELRGCSPTLKPIRFVA